MNGEEVSYVPKLVKENASEVHKFLAEMADWEKNARREDESLLGGRRPEKDYPPVRSESEAFQAFEKSKDKIPTFDYTGRDKYDADGAREDVDKKRNSDKKDRQRQEAQLEKEKGNKFVQDKNWDSALRCYSRAIELYDGDAIYFANRALCYLKMEKYIEAESDCTRSLFLDPKYVKALQRRSCARENLGRHHDAATDLGEILKIEPQNVTVRRQLAALIQKLGETNRKSNEEASAKSKDDGGKRRNGKDDKSKTHKEQPPHKDSKQSKKSKKKSHPEEMFVEAINKPPHLRSKRPLERIPIAEIPKGSSITAISLKSSANDFTKLVAKYINKKNPFKARDELRRKKNDKASPPKIDNPKTTPPKEKHKKPNRNFTNVEDSNKNDALLRNRLDADSKDIKFSVPKSSVQFISDWRLLKDNEKMQSEYLKAIKPLNIPVIFKESLESDIFSDILRIICNGDDFQKSESQSFLYLQYLSQVKRFSTLVMFMNDEDKKVLLKILNRCKENGECTEDEIQQMKIKYEL